MTKRSQLLITSYILILGISAFSAYQFGKRKLVSSDDQNEAVASSPTCPYTMPGEAVGQYVKSNNEVEVTYAPEIIKNPELIIIKKPFKGNEYEEKILTYEGEDKWDTRKFDVDGDGKDEEILSAKIAMNHTPHIALVVKNGNIIFESGGANIWIESLPLGEGFILEQTIDWDQVGERKLTRYVPKEGGFLPIWTQKICRVEFE